MHKVNIVIPIVNLQSAKNKIIEQKSITYKKALNIFKKLFKCNDINTKIITKIENKI